MLLLVLQMHRNGYELLRHIIVVEDRISQSCDTQQRQGRRDEQRSAKVCSLGRRRRHGSI